MLQTFAETRESTWRHVHQLSLEARSLPLYSAESALLPRPVLTFDFEVVASKVVRIKVEGQRRVGLIQEQVDAGHLDPVPFKHRPQNLSGEKAAPGSFIHPHDTLAPLLLLTLGFSSSLQGQSQCLCPHLGRT